MGKQLINLNVCLPTIFPPRKKATLVFFWIRSEKKPKLAKLYKIIEILYMPVISYTQKNWKATCDIVVTLVSRKGHNILWPIRFAYVTGNVPFASRARF